MNVPELLAPVGSRDALTAAVQNGADAVYLGGTMFSARQFADNFDRPQMREAIEYAHIRGVRVYVTANTLIADREMAEALDYLKFLYEAGVDAVIVQDLGLAGLAHRLLPGLELHASTQMTVHNSGGVEILLNNGFSRVVLAREMSLKEIADIKASTGADLEVFVHGALCICYSGQCLMSSMIGGRSGNRGRCAQPCRMEYELVDDKGAALVDTAQIGAHLLSPRDLNMLGHIPALAEAGINSLKIEGRMKRPEYVATITRIYRQALDRYRTDPAGYRVEEKELREAAQIFNRGFTEGYFFGRQGRDMMSYKRPNNRGLRLGRVTVADWAKKSVEILLEDTLRLGDGLEFWVTEGGRKGITVSQMWVNGVPVEEAAPGQKVTLQVEGKIRSGDRVFKTHDALLMGEAEQSYRSSKELKKIPLVFKVRAGVGEPLNITVSDGDGNIFSADSEFTGQEAISKPLTLETLTKQLDRLGNTPFSIGSLEADIGESVMVPASAINETRRQAVEGLAALRAQAAVKRAPVAENFSALVEGALAGPAKGAPREIDPAAIQLSVRAATLDLVIQAARNGADLIYFGGADLKRDKSAVLADLDQAEAVCRENGCRLAAAPPRIIRDNEIEYVQVLLDYARNRGLPVLAGNLGLLDRLGQTGGYTIFADYPLNIFNTYTIGWLDEGCGAAQAAVSPEMTLNQIRELGRPEGMALEALVEGHIPLMVTEYCPQGSMLGEMASGQACRKPCRQSRRVGLKDRLGLVFPMAHDEFCRTYIYNAKELSMVEDIHPLAKAGISTLRIEFSVEEPARAGQVVRLWRQEIDKYIQDPKRYEPAPDAKEKLASMSPAGLTKGHYYRGVE